MTGTGDRRRRAPTAAGCRSPVPSRPPTVAQRSASPGGTLEDGAARLPHPNRASVPESGPVAAGTFVPLASRRCTSWLVSLPTGPRVMGTAHRRGSDLARHCRGSSAMSSPARPVRSLPGDGGAPEVVHPVVDPVEDSAVPTAVGRGPYLPRTLVPRSRLWAALDNTEESAVRLVVAPAGSGKTLGVAGWIAQQGRHDTSVWANAGPELHPAALDASYCVLPRVSAGAAAPRRRRRRASASSRDGRAPGPAALGGPGPGAHDPAHALGPAAAPPRPRAARSSHRPSRRLPPHRRRGGADVRGRARADRRPGRRGGPRGPRPTAGAPPSCSCAAPS